jgi:hypothetical protein
MDATFPALRTIRLNASLADLQKGVPKIAVWMYAFLLRNFTIFSKIHKQHWQQQRRASPTLLLSSLAFFCKYDTKVRTIWVTAIIKDPKAAVPR